MLPFLNIHVVRSLWICIPTCLYVSTVDLRKVQMHFGHHQIYALSIIL